MIRSLALAVLLTLSLAACGKKKAPAAPSAEPPATEASPSGGEGDMRDESTPDDADDQPKSGADPDAGGE